MEIDGNLRMQAVRNLNDMIEPISDMEEYAKISLDQMRTEDVIFVSSFLATSTRRVSR